MPWVRAATLVALGFLLHLEARPALAQDNPAATDTTPPTPAVEASPPRGEVFAPPDVVESTGGETAPAATVNGNAGAKTPAPAMSPAGTSAKSPARAGRSTAGKQGDAGGPANSSPFAALTSPGSGPINIKSDSLSVDYKNNSAVWRGHVHAVRADGEMTSDTLQVTYGKDFHELQQLIASGDVRISRGTQWSHSDHAVLNEANQTVVLTGNPVVHDGNDQITGNKITVYLKTGESVVEGAKAVIFPRPAKTRDNGATADRSK
jgi:lipopolysaccharide export system protein LptA